MVAGMPLDSELNRRRRVTSLVRLSTRSTHAADNTGSLYAATELRSQEEFHRVVLVPKHGHEGWLPWRPVVHSNRKFHLETRLRPLLTGVTSEDEVCHPDHMASEDQWSLYTGTKHMFEHRDSRIPMVVTSALRHGKANINFATNAMGHVSLTEV